MKIRLTMLAISLLFTPYAIAEDQTDSLNNDMSSDVVKVIKKYNGRWKGWSDGCVNCDKPLSVTVYKKKNTAKNKVKKAKAKTTDFRAPIKQGYCECNCKPLKEIEKAESKKEEDASDAPKKEIPVSSKSKKE